ncbi:MAG: TIM barrel protein [Bacteroidales bacterium]
MTTRRSFLKKSLMATGALLGYSSLKTFAFAGNEIKISLAEWSFNRALDSGKMDHLDFPSIAKKEFGISAVEYVNGFFGGKKMNFKKAAVNKPYLSELLKRSKDAGVFNHLIMVDDEGPLSSVENKIRLRAVEDHKKWIEAARFLEAPTVRVNLHGEGSSEDRKNASIDSLGKLGEFAKTMQINVVVENHGSYTSNAEWLVDVMKQVNMENIGTLPDFGNWCITHPWGTIQEGCKESYDIYEGLKLLLPYAKGVSAKTYDFNSDGEQALLDYKRLISIVKDFGFKGYIGLEYEGKNQVDEYEGVRKTQKLVLKYL